jgi:hypothetical protein
MRKIAIRIGIIVVLMVIAVVVLITIKLQSPPALLQFVPKGVTMAAYVDTRNLVKKALETGSTPIEGIDFPAVFEDIFSTSKDIKEPGINLFSEVVWFYDASGYECFMTRISNAEKWSKFMEKVSDSSAIENYKEVNFFNNNERNTTIAWKDKMLCFFIFKDSATHHEFKRIAINRTFIANERSEILLNAYSKTKADVFFANIKEKEYLELKLFGGKAKFRFFQKVNFDTWETLSPNKMNFPSNSDTNIVFIASEKFKKLDSKNIQTQDSILLSIGFKESLDSFWSKDKSMKASDFINQESGLKTAMASNNLMEYTVLQDSTFLPYYLNTFIGQIENVKSIEKYQIGEVTEGVVYFRERKPLPFAEGLRYFISQREDYLLKNKKN